MRIVDNTYEADKAVEAMMDDKNYTLVVRCQHNPPHFLYVPLPIDGAMTNEAAAVVCKDALIVAKHKMAEHHERKTIDMDRVDGIPDAEHENIGGLVSTSFVFNSGAKPK